MSTTVRFITDYAGIGEVALRSAQVRAMIHAKAQAVADNVSDPQAPVVVRDAGTSRARSLAVLDSPVGAVIESQKRLLGTALDGARG